MWRQDVKSKVNKTLQVFLVDAGIGKAVTGQSGMSKVPISYELIRS